MEFVGWVSLAVAVLAFLGLNKKAEGLLARWGLLEVEGPSAQPTASVEPSPGKVHTTEETINSLAPNPGEAAFEWHPESPEGFTVAPRAMPTTDEVQISNLSRFEVIVELADNDQDPAMKVVAPAGAGPCLPYHNYAWVRVGAEKRRGPYALTRGRQYDLEFVSSMVDADTGDRNTLFRFRPAAPQE